MEFAGYLASALIGLSLGMIGGGGSILTVPVLVYLFHQPASSATTDSLLVVGLTALVGSFAYWKQGLVDMRTAIAFGIPSLISVIVTKMVITPAIPDPMLRIGSFVLTKDKGLLVLFAILMVLAATSMLKPKKEIGPDEAGLASPSPVPWKVALAGAGVGFVTGLVGAGGGFLLVPALVVLMRLPMKTAVGTSLLLIGVNATIGFTSALVREPQREWGLIATITAIALIGLLIGSRLSRHVSAAKLKVGFGVFVLVFGSFVILKELLLA